MEVIKDGDKTIFKCGPKPTKKPAKKKAEPKPEEPEEAPAETEVNDNGY
jgi:hypothetical protein